jgi:hypothetical protein
MTDTRKGADLDQLSLAQALIDFEVANARVIDLTARLVDAHRKNAELSAELDTLQAQVASANRVLGPLRRLGLPWVVQRARSLRHALRS